ncbi:MAG: hypothetical protein ACP5DQ_11990 [Bacteroidales bacterium]
MKQILIIISAVLFFNQSNAQKIEFNKNLEIDTLFLWLEISNKIEDSMRIKILDQFDKTISNFNRLDNNYMALIRNGNFQNSIKMSMGDINYVNTKRRVYATLLNLAILGADILMVNAGLLVIIPPILTPSTSSSIEMEIPKNMLHPRNRNKNLRIGPGAYFINIEKQQSKFIRKFDKKVSRFLNNLNRNVNAP